LSTGDLITPIRLEWLAVMLGIASTVGGFLLAAAGSARLVRVHAPDALLLPFGIVVMVSLTGMWFYATSGLETGLAFLWLGLAWWTLARWSTPPGRFRSSDAFVLGLGWLVRPELALVSIITLAMVLLVQWRTDTWRRRFWLLAIAFALPFSYQIFRMGYYGALVPNTAIVKEGTRAHWDRGWIYLRDFVDTYWLLVPAAVLLAGGYVPLALALRQARHRRAILSAGAFLLASILHAVYIVGVGGDYEHARLLLPSAFAFCAPVAAVPMIRRNVVALAAVPWALAAVLFMRPPEFRLGETYLTPPTGRVTTDDGGWEKGGERAALFTDSGLYFQRLPKLQFYRAEVPLSSEVREPQAAVFAVGIMPYAIGEDLYVLDLFGLADPITARMENDPGPDLSSYPGQEKPLPHPWTAARVLAPDRAFDESQFNFRQVSLIPRTRGREFLEQIEWARRALECDPIRQVERSARAPMTLSRFVRNVVDSFANTRLRIPPDPETAYRELCDDEEASTGSPESRILHSGLPVDPWLPVVAVASHRPRAARRERPMSRRWWAPSWTTWRASHRRSRVSPLRTSGRVHSSGRTLSSTAASASALAASSSATRPGSPPL
jgi:arabinofuranosyltransferase